MAETKITSYTVGRTVRLFVSETNFVEFPLTVTAENPDGIDRAEIVKTERAVEQCLLHTMMRVHGIRGKQSDAAHVAKTYGLARTPLTEEKE